MLVIRLNGGRGDSSMIAAFSKELVELDMGDWHKLAGVACHLVKCEFFADPPSYRSLSPSGLTSCATSG